MGLDFFRRSIELHRALRAAGPAGPQHAPDQRHAARRRVGRVPRRAPLPRRHLHRRPARDPRHLPRRQGRQADLRPGHARARRARATTVDYNVLTTVHAANETTAAARSTASCATSAAPSSCSSSPSSSGRRPRRSPPPTPAGATAASCRPLYVLDGSLVTDRTVSPERLRPLPHRRLRGLGAPRHRRGLRPDVRHRARQLGRRAGRHVRPRRDLRAAARPRAQRRPLLLRPLRGAALQAGQHPRAADARHGRLARSSATSGRTSATRSPGTASTATSASPATAAAPRTASRPRRTASRASTTCARATRRSSTTSTRPMGRMRDLLRGGPARRRAHGRYAAEDARRGRNDPCTCGSGRKWKVCHGAAGGGVAG